jgi:hypothetical protein
MPSLRLEPILGPCPAIGDVVVLDDGDTDDLIGYIHAVVTGESVQLMAGPQKKPSWKAWFHISCVKSLYVEIR